VRSPWCRIVAVGLLAPLFALAGGFPGGTEASQGGANVRRKLNGARTGDERELNARMSELGRKSGEARRRRRDAQPQGEESTVPEDLAAWATSRLVELARSTNNAAASVAAAKELLNRAPEPDLDVADAAARGMTLADLVNANRDYKREAAEAMKRAARRRLRPRGARQGGACGAEREHRDGSTALTARRSRTALANPRPGGRGRGVNDSPLSLNEASCQRDP
jgi:hypothetical protein